MPADQKDWRAGIGRFVSSLGNALGVCVEAPLGQILTGATTRETLARRVHGGEDTLRQMDASTAIFPRPAFTL